MKNLWKFSLAIAVLIFAVACSNDDSSEAGKARVAVSLTDAPGDYDAVYVDVQDVVIKYSDSEGDVSIGAINAGIYNLLELTGGVSVLLVNDEIPSGHISQMRLILGSENSVVVDGVSYPLATPSAEQSGLKLQINETLEPGIFYEFILDFDVEESIVVQGNGSYVLKPVIRASTVAESGAITGFVLPLNTQTLVTATNANTTISAYTNLQGKFFLHGVPDGIYTVTIQPEIISGLETVVLTNVEVSNGLVTDLGTTTLL
ncbi:MAG: carbohydrate-binding protein [Flavobacteriaceae bacterium CG2_30_34_30]|nr:MAG: carbohydrate-binding protein [Flavobacteriaceae bacterium CG2_30_34_30]